MTNSLSRRIETCAALSQEWRTDETLKGSEISEKEKGGVVGCPEKEED